jgi:hypothetical protein
MVLNSYEDKDLVQNVEKVVEEAIQHDHESSESTIIETDNYSCPNEVTMTPEDIVIINEDLSVIKLRKTASSDTRLARTTSCLEKQKTQRNLRRAPQRPRRSRFPLLFYTKAHIYERAQLCINYKRIAKSQAIVSCASGQSNQATYFQEQKKLVLKIRQVL